MNRIGSIATKHHDGTPRTFEVFVSEERVTSGLVWNFSVRPVTLGDGSEEAYSARIVETDDGVAQVDTTYNFLPEQFHRCGISRALFPRVATHLSRTLRSSRNADATQTKGITSMGTLEVVEETLSEPARKVWERLVQDGLATYDTKGERFSCQAGRLKF